MVRLLKFVSLLGLVLALWGCGGAGADTQNPFAGNYLNGTWDESSINTLGTWSVTISGAGQIAGTATSSAQPGLTGVVSGSVATNGVLNATCTYGGQAPTTIAGAVGFTSQAHVHGTLSENVGGNLVPMTLDMNKT